MSWAALTSGGKDSILSCQMAIDSGKDVRYLVTARPGNPDSSRSHSPNPDTVPDIAKAAGTEYVGIVTHGRRGEELVDPESGLAGLDIGGAITGAGVSVCQADRVRAITNRLGLSLFTPLWHMDTEMLVREVAGRMDARIVVTAAHGIDESFLSARFDDDLIRRLKQVAAARHINLAGEGGGYERLIPDTPFNSRPITFATSEIRSAPGRHELVLGGFA
jgi:diphthine-ammonia ligase